MKPSFLPVMDSKPPHKKGTPWISQIPDLVGTPPKINMAMNKINYLKKKHLLVNIKLFSS